MRCVQRIRSTAVWLVVRSMIVAQRGWCKPSRSVCHSPPEPGSWFAVLTGSCSETGKFFWETLKRRRLRKFLNSLLALLAIQRSQMFQSIWRLNDALWGNITLCIIWLDSATCDDVWNMKIEGRNPEQQTVSGHSCRVMAVGVLHLRNKHQVTFCITCPGLGLDKR